MIQFSIGLIGIKNFGFNDLEPIRSHDAVSAYVTKYITKDLQRTVKELNAHTYYCSKGLNTAKEKSTKKMDLSPLSKLKPDYETEYSKTYWLTEEQFNALVEYSDHKLLPTRTITQN